MSDPLLERAYDALTDPDADATAELPEDAAEHQPRNFLIHATALSATKTGDGLVDPKLVLAWLLDRLGASDAVLGWLVPIREAGALLPQLPVSGWVATRKRRKFVWAGASFAQGAAVLGMGLVAWLLPAGTAVGTIVGLLVVFALARSLASLSYKDVLGRTVAQSTRGTATGTAGTVSSALVLAYGALLASGVLPLSITTVSVGLLVGGTLWILAGTLFLGLDEEGGAGDGKGRQGLGAQFALLRARPQLRLFILTRSLLVATALGTPYLVALSGGDGSGGLGSLGPFVTASALASLGSSYVWGRLADRSSRRALQAAGVGAALTMGAAAALAFTAPSFAARTWTVATLVALLALCHQGVRLGRSTHLVDMAPEDDRAAYTALSNTVIGLVLVVGGALGHVAEVAGLGVVLGVLGAAAAAAVVAARGLDEVQARD